MVRGGKTARDGSERRQREGKRGTVRGSGERVREGAARGGSERQAW